MTKYNEKFIKATIIVFIVAKAEEKPPHHKARHFEKYAKIPFSIVEYEQTILQMLENNIYKDAEPLASNRETPITNPSPSCLSAQTAEALSSLAEALRHKSP